MCVYLRWTACKHVLPVRARIHVSRNATKQVLHAHVVRGSNDNTDFKSQKIPFTRDNQYMIAAYNYSLAEIEERLFCRVLRAKFPKKSDKSRAPEPRVHFALSLGCASSPRSRLSLYFLPRSLFLCVRVCECACLCARGCMCALACLPVDACAYACSLC